MQRREFMGLIGSAAAWPHLARAQRSGTPRVGYVSIGERSTDVSGAGLRQGLIDKGYELGAISCSKTDMPTAISKRYRRSLPSFSRSRSTFL